MVNNFLITPAISWGKRDSGGVGPLDSHDERGLSEVLLTCNMDYTPENSDFEPKKSLLPKGKSSSKPSSLGILAHLLRMASWNLNTFLFGGDCTPLAHHLTFGDWIPRDFLGSKC